MLGAEAEWWRAGLAAQCRCWEAPARGPDGEFWCAPRSRPLSSRVSKAQKGKAISETVFHDLGRPQAGERPFEGSRLLFQGDPGLEWTLCLILPVMEGGY